MKLIVGLGNPGEKYLLTPHNIGWLVVDAFACHYDIQWSLKKKFSAQTTEQESSLLVKPMTYMNLSGTAVKSLMNYYRIGLDKLLIIHDDLDLPFLSLRFQKNRGPASHNGLLNINQELGSQNYTRMRIGIKADLPDPASSLTRTQKVLKPFTKTERNLLPDFLNKAVEALQYFITEGLEKTANHYNADTVKEEKKQP